MPFFKSLAFGIFIIHIRKQGDYRQLPSDIEMHEMGFQ
jgi:hypothetical protein